MLTRSMVAELTTASASECLFSNFLSEIEPKMVFEALKHPGWVNVMQKELNQFYKNKSYVYNPKESHLIDLKRILMYLKGTPTLGMYYPKCSGFDLKGCLDSVYAGCNIDRKSTSGASQILGGKLVRWSAKKQQSVAMSSAENYLREFWSTAIAYDPSSSIDEIKQHPLREFLIKFLVLNGQRPLTFDHNTFVHHLALIIKMDVRFRFLPDILSNSNFTKYPSKVPNIELTDHMIAVNNQKDVVVTPSKEEKSPVQKGTQGNQGNTTPKPTEGFKQFHSVSSSIVLDPQDPKRNIQLAGTGLPSTLDEGTRKLQPFPEGTTTDPKDSWGNDQPTNKGFPSTTFNKVKAKTTSHPEGPLGDIDSEGNKAPADMEPINPTVADPSRTGAEYQKSDEKEVFAAGYDIEENTQADEEEHQSPSPNKDKPEPSHTPETQESNSDSSSPDLKIFNNILSLTERQLIKVNLLNALNGGTKTIKAVQDAVKDDLAINKKVIKATKAYTKNSSALTKQLSLVKYFEFQGLKSSVESFQFAALRQDEHLVS
uniref:Uncharacterized mitochondrial protein AtMg00810-like n=1 Tax=Tanacetum cinerariifolium TaxID=118510 RepID=A0A699IUD0_TANCI|nr:uncharacterized mitochondrial protein AtMg00810-like [Tanacetum cinerariifolium]